MEEAERFPYYGGLWKGPQAVVDNLIIPLARDWEGFSVTPHEFVCNDEHVVSFGLYNGKFRATGLSISAPFAHRWVGTRGKTRSLQAIYRYREDSGATVPRVMPVSPNERHGSAFESAMKHGSEDMPIACQLTEELRVREATLLAQFRSAVFSTEDLADGYAFRIPDDAKWIALMAELITAERRCCPFLTFELAAQPDMAP